LSLVPAQGVVAVLTVDDIVALQPDDDVWTGRPDQDVVARRPEDGRGLSGASQAHGPVVTCQRRTGREGHHADRQTRDEGAYGPGPHGLPPSSELTTSPKPTPW